MATYYVSSSGSDSNNGLGPDASHASNKPFLTIGKLIAASGAMASGDTAYVAPGTYRETVTVGITSPTSETRILGDPLNAQGFKNGSGVLLAPGDVVWTAYTTNDKTTPTAANLLNLNTRDYLTFERLLLVGGDATRSVLNGSTATPTNITLRDCVLFSARAGSTLVEGGGTADVALNWLLDRCVMLGNSGTNCLFTLPTSTTADYDANVVLQNCVFVGAASTRWVGVTASGANSFKGGGVEVWNCTAIGGAQLLGTASANVSTSIPCLCYNNVMFLSGTAISANTSGQITEDYNLIHAGTARNNVTAGSNSKVSPNYAPMLHLGEEWLHGLELPRPFGSPWEGSNMLGFGNQASGPTVDVMNRPRPAGGSSTAYAVGAFERHDNGTKSSAGNADGASGAAIELTGPRDVDLWVPVKAATTTLSVKVKWDSNHADTNKPQAILLAQSEIGVTTETVTATGSAGSGYETLTFSSFTPTDRGVVTLRLRARSAAGNGLCWFDTLGVNAATTAPNAFDYWHAGQLLPFQAGAESTVGFDYWRGPEPFPGLTVQAAVGILRQMMMHHGG